jgi:ribose transport system ATP-binding protein
MSAAGAAPCVLQVRDVAKRFGATMALDGVDLALRAGEVHALIGENGAGKSTLLNVLAGALRPDRGEMHLDGQAYGPASPLEARRRGIALIHQDLSLCPHLSVAENILLGIEPARWGGWGGWGGWVDRGAARQRALELLGHFAHPQLHAERRVGDLPLAARQVVEICRALAADARILLMDEPTSSLEREEVDRLFEVIRRLTARGIAVMYVSHFLEEVREIAGPYTVLRDGRSVDSGMIADTSNDHLIMQMVGRPIDGLFPARAQSGPPPSGARARSGEGRGASGWEADREVVLAVHDIAAPPALKQASFELRRGEILGIAGLIGSGRTELVRALFGLEPRAAGRIALRGRTLDVHGTSPAQRLRQGFGYLSEDRKREGLALPLSVADNLTATRLSACSPGWGWLDLRRQWNVTREWIAALRIRAADPVQPVRALSGGNQQKVAIGRLLNQDAEVLLLDEPTRGIDIGSKAQIYDTIVRCAAEGKAVLLVSSYLPELFGLCDRLAVMSRGRLSRARPIDEWTPEKVLATAIGEQAREGEA